MTMEDVKEAIKEDETRQKHGKDAQTHSTGSRYSVATTFLKAMSELCRAFDTSKEAAEYARRKCFALWDYYGMHSLFVTITPRRRLLLSHKAVRRLKTKGTSSWSCSIQCFCSARLTSSCVHSCCAFSMFSHPLTAQKKPVSWISGYEGLSGHNTLEHARWSTTAQCK